MAIKENACKRCGYVLEDQTIDTCPACENKKFTTFWKGSVIVTDPENSEVAKKLNITNKGKFALRIN